MEGAKEAGTSYVGLIVIFLFYAGPPAVEPTFSQPNGDNILADYFYLDSITSDLTGFSLRQKRLPFSRPLFVRRRSLSDLVRWYEFPLAPY